MLFLRSRSLPYQREAPYDGFQPLALKVLGSYDYETEGFRSKSWEEFAGSGAPEMDFIFTVCDTAAGEACPVWPGIGDGALGHRRPDKG
jgi:protein-tyrosine-phosphatase